MALNTSGLFIHMYNYMNCWFQCAYIHTYTCSSKVECIFLWHLFFCAAMDRTNCSTNGTMTGIGNREFCSVTVIIYVANIAFTAVFLSPVLAASAVRGTIRIVLTNILIASITVCFGVPLICLHLLLISKNSQFSSSYNVSFKIYLAIMAIGGNGRSAFMAVFAVVVVVIIKCSNSAVKFKYLIISVVVVWIACVAVGAILVVPGVVERSPFHCSSGLPFQPGNEIWIFLLFVLSLICNYSVQFGYCFASVCFVPHQIEFDA